MSLVDDGFCFVCGKRNESGLQIEWRQDGRTAHGKFVPQKRHQGWKDLVHGGVLAAVLDEAMTRLAWQLEGQAVTAEMTVRYRRPTPVGETLDIAGEVAETGGRLLQGSARIKNPKGEIVAEASAKILITNRITSNLAAGDATGGPPRPPARRSLRTDVGVRSGRTRGQNPARSR